VFRGISAWFAMYNAGMNEYLSCFQNIGN